jgi:hypothetical protein
MSKRFFVNLGLNIPRLAVKRNISMRRGFSLSGWNQAWEDAGRKVGLVSATVLWKVSRTSTAV